MLKILPLIWLVGFMAWDGVMIVKVIPIENVATTQFAYGLLAR